MDRIRQYIVNNPVLGHRPTASQQPFKMVKAIAL